MFDSTQFAVFLAASIALIVTPGPAVVFIVARGVQQGRYAAVVTACGVAVGNFVHACAAAFGLSAILASADLAYLILKYAGAVYLIFLGLRSFAAKNSDRRTGIRPAGTHTSNFRDGVVVALLNPKTILFFLAFLPQFTTPGRHPLWIQLLALGVLFVVMGLVGDATYGFLSGTLGQRLKQQTALTGFGRFLSGIVYCTLGIFAAISGRFSG